MGRVCDVYVDSKINALSLGVFRATFLAECDISVKPEADRREIYNNEYRLTVMEKKQ